MNNYEAKKSAIIDEMKREIAHKPKSQRDWKVVGDHKDWKIEHDRCDCYVCFMGRED